MSQLKFRKMSKTIQTTDQILLQTSSTNHPQSLNQANKIDEICDYFNTSPHQSRHHLKILKQNRTSSFTKIDMIKHLSPNHLIKQTNKRTKRKTQKIKKKSNQIKLSEIDLESYTFENELTVEEEEKESEATPSPLRTSVARVGTVHISRAFFLSSSPPRPCIALHFSLRVPSIRPPNGYLSFSPLEFQLPLFHQLKPQITNPYLCQKSSLNQTLISPITNPKT